MVLPNTARVGDTAIERLMVMGNSSEYANASVSSTDSTIHSLIGSLRGWLRNFIYLLAVKRRHELLSAATRRQLDFKTMVTQSHE